MCLKIRPRWPMPGETGRIGKIEFDEGSPYRLTGAQLFEKLKEADYADLYPAEGQPALSPVILAFVTAFQYMEKLSDRQVAESLRMRLDWEYAFHLS